MARLDLMYVKLERVTQEPVDLKTMGLGPQGLALFRKLGAWRRVPPESESTAALQPVQPPVTLKPTPPLAVLVL
jgi:hypothetical protein